MIGAAGIDLLSTAAIRDPHTPLRRMREQDEVLWSTRHKCWVLTGHAAVDAAFRDKRLSAARGMAAFRSRLQKRHADLVRNALELLDGWMLFNDPPAHTRLRDPVRRAFSLRVVQALAPRIEQRVGVLLDACDAEADLVSGFAQPLTAGIIGDLLGIDDEARAFVHQWTRDFGQLIYGVSSREDGFATAIARAGDEFRARMAPLIEAQEAAVDGNLIARVKAASQAFDWTPSELLGAVSMLLFAGHDTTSALIASATRVAAGDARVREALRGDEASAASAVEELLRIEGPSKTFVRVAPDAHERGGHHIAAGDTLWLSVLGANRDPNVFAAPDIIDPARDPNPHLGFGGGIHFCLGAALARLEARIALGSLWRRFPDLRIAVADSALRWHPGVVDRSLVALPVQLNRAT